MALSREQHFDMYYYLLLGRALEERLETLYKQGKIPGAIYQGRGQEACYVGSAYALEPGDVIAPTHRDMIAMLPRGMDIKLIVAQHLAKVTGPTKGRGEDNYLGDLSRGIFTTVSMLPDFYPVAAGAALAFKIQGESRVALAYCGEGATSRGDWHEALNFAAVKTLPVVFFVINNQFAFSTPAEKGMKIGNVANRASAYGMPGITVDGNDPIEVFEAVKRSVDLAREGQGPSLIEAKTLRMKGHAGHDRFTYAPSGLIEQWEEKDPINRFEILLRDEWQLNDEEKQQIEIEIQMKIDGAVAFAEASPLPDPNEVTKDVYH